eukprot:g1595.t1
MVCKALGLNGGVRSGRTKLRNENGGPAYDTFAMKIGKCESGDDRIDACTGGSNEFGMIRPSSHCRAGQNVRFEVVCDANVTAPGAGECMDCRGGSWWNDTSTQAGATCSACPAGRFSTAVKAMSQATCNECAAGLVSQAGATECTFCLGQSLDLAEADCQAWRQGFASGLTIGKDCDTAEFHTDPCLCRHVRCDKYDGVRYITEIRLGSKAVVGTCPAAWGALHRLRKLELHDNAELGGPLPGPEWATLTSLQYLRVDRTDVSGELPSDWGDGMKLLKELWAYDTMVEGALPAEWGGMRSMEKMDLHTTRVQGPLPGAWANMVNMKHLLLYNIFTLDGDLPAEWARWAKVISVQLHKCALTGTLPPEYADMNKLKTLYLHGNQLRGSLPGEWGGGMPMVEKLHLYDNGLEGALPAQWGNFQALRELKARKNKFSGPLPEAWAAMPQVVYLDLGENELTGELPTVWGQLSSQLAHVALDKNRLSGQVPASLSTALFEKLGKDAKLGFNRFRCPLPPDLPASTGAACCPLGTFSVPHDDADPHTCRACPRDDANIPTTPGADCVVCNCSSAACPRGQYGELNATTRSTVCLACPRGQFQELPGAVGRNSCKSCKAATNNVLTDSAPGSTSSAACEFVWRRKCPTGSSVVHSATDNCALCHAGRFKNGTNKLPCESCPCGQWQSLPGQASCDAACPPGTFGNGSSGRCDRCPLSGFYCVDSLLRPFSKATMCSPGQRELTAPSSTADRTCGDCPPGRFSTTENVPSCDACPGGKHQAAAKATFCIACQGGRFSTATNAKACKVCAAGRFGDMSTPQGSEAHCTLCPKGKVQPEPAQPFCETIQPCDPGSFRNETGSCITCPAGSWCSAERVYACGGAGFYCPRGSATPHAVAVGFYTTPVTMAETNRTGQRPCEKGYFCKSGLRSKCPSGRLCRLSDAVAQSSGDVAQISTAASRVQITVQDRCPEGEFAFDGTECVPCPVEGAMCTDGRIYLRTGFWYDKQHGSLADFWYKRHTNRIDKSMGLYRCPRPERCQVEPVTGLPLCADNHGGPLCSVCDKGHYHAGLGEGCQPCPDSSETAVSTTGLLLGLFALYRFLVFVWRQVKRHWPDADLTKMTYAYPQIIKLITGVFQIVASFQESFEAVPWPASYLSVIDYVGSVVSFDLFGQPVFACQATGDNFKKRFLWHTLMVLVVTVVLAFLLILANVTKSRWKKRKSVLWNILLPFLFLVYPSVSKTSVLMLRCRTIDGGSYLLADFSVRCDDGDYAPFQAAGWLFTALFVVGIPVLFAAILSFNRNNLPPDWWPEETAEQEDREFSTFRSTKGNEWVERAEWRENEWRPYIARCHKFEQRFGFLFNAYKKRYFWFESVMSFYKFGMTTLVIFVSGADGPGGTTLKILFSMFGATCLIALVAFLQPYKDADVLSIETLVNLEVLFVLFAALYLQHAAGAEGSIAVGVGLIVLLLLPVVVLGFMFYNSVREEMAQNRERQLSDATPGDRISSPSIRSLLSPKSSRGKSASSFGDLKDAATPSPKSTPKVGRKSTFHVANPMSNVEMLASGKFVTKNKSGPVVANPMVAVESPPELAVDTHAPREKEPQREKLRMGRLSHIFRRAGKKQHAPPVLAVTERAPAPEHCHEHGHSTEQPETELPPKKQASPAAGLTEVVTVAHSRDRARSSVCEL